MNVVIIFLAWAISTVHANILEKNDIHRVASSAFIKKSYWTEQQEEAAEKRRKKYRLGNTSSKDKSNANKRQLVPTFLASMDDKIRLSYDPIVYKPQKNEHVFKLQPSTERLKLIAQVRNPDFMHQHPVNTNILLR